MPGGRAITQIDGRAQRFQSTFITGLNLAESPLELLRLAGDHFLEMSAVGLDLSLQTLLLECSFQARHYDFVLEWLDEVIGRALSLGSEAGPNAGRAPPHQQPHL